MADPEELIDPGSLPYGERDDYVAGARDVLQGSPAPLGGGTTPPGAAPPLADDDALDPDTFLMEGGFSSDLPVTSGLEQGPGPGPFGGIQATPQQQKLMELAQNSPSAVIRHKARLALRKYQSVNQE